MDRATFSRTISSVVQFGNRVWSGHVRDWADFVEYRRYLFLRPSSLIVLAVAIVAASQFYGWGFAKPEAADRSVAIITGVAMAGWLIGSSVNLHSRIKQHTFDLIYRARFDVGYREQATEILKQCSGDVVEESHIQRAMEVSYRDANEDPHDNEDAANADWRLFVALTVVSNFIEAVALSVRTCEADEKILRGFYESILKSNARRLQHLFVYYRRRTKSDRAFEHIVWLTRRWDGELPIIDEFERSLL